MFRRHTRPTGVNIYFSRIVVIVSMILISFIFGGFLLPRSEGFLSGRPHELLSYWLAFVVGGAIAGICLNRVYYPAHSAKPWWDWRNILLIGFALFLVVWVSAIALALISRARMVM